MVDASSRDRDELWARAHADALKYALYRTRNASRADELAADALCDALDPDRSPWDPGGHRTLSQHVVNLVHEALKAEREKRRVRENPLNAGAVDEAMRPTVPRPDAGVLARERHERGLARERRVRAGLDPFANEVLDLFGEGLSPSEQALRLGTGVGRIYEARRRIAERIHALPVETGDADDERARDEETVEEDESDEAGA